MDYSLMNNYLIKSETRNEMKNIIWMNCSINVFVQNIKNQFKNLQNRYGKWKCRNCIV